LFNIKNQNEKYQQNTGNQKPQKNQFSYHEFLMPHLKKSGRRTPTMKS